MEAKPYAKLSYIQSELKAPKNQFNSFGKYHYRSCEDIIEAVKPFLAVYKCAITLRDEVVSIGNRNYVKATAVFYDVEDLACSLECTAYAREEETKKGMDGSQITGAASSYARKYALNGLLLIDDNKDSDTTNTNNGNTEPAKQPPKPATKPNSEPKLPPVLDTEIGNDLPF